MRQRACSLRLRYSWPLVTLTAAAACGDGGTGPRVGPPAALEKLSTDPEYAITGAALPESLVVRVLDASNNPVPGATVSWQVTAGGGAITPASATTDGTGIARAQWVLGEQVGTQSAFANTGGPTLRVEFATTAEFPDPPAGPTVELQLATTVGKRVFPSGNSERGGQGEPLSGMGCIETIADHVHGHVGLYVAHEQLAIPEAIGIVDPVIVNGWAGAGSCFYWLHTHDGTGIIHIEPPTHQDSLTLGQLFDVWGHTLSREEVAGFEGPVTVFVNRERYRGDLRSIVLSSHQQVALYVGRPSVPLPNYVIPYSR
jgi:hypothetical protein